MASDRVTDVNGAARDGPGSGVELGTGVGGLKHIPIWVDEIAHPQAIVRTMHHMTSLQPKRTVGIP